MQLVCDGFWMTFDKGSLIASIDSSVNPFIIISVEAVNRVYSEFRIYLSEYFLVTINHRNRIFKLFTHQKYTIELNGNVQIQRKFILLDFSN